MGLRVTRYKQGTDDNTQRRDKHEGQRAVQQNHK